MRKISTHLNPFSSLQDVPKVQNTIVLSREKRKMLREDKKEVRRKVALYKLDLRLKKFYLYSGISKYVYQWIFLHKVHKCYSHDYYICLR